MAFGNSGGPSMSHSSDSNHNLTLHEKILKQIEYYLSDHNLLTDTFLRKKLNESPQKEVPLSLFTKFPRMASICTDIPTIADALRQSTRLYVNNTGTTVRRRIPFNGKKASDIVCKMFAAGKCKYGKKCRFKHEMGEDTGLGGWAAVEPTEEKSTRKRGLEDTELESGLAKQTAEINPLKRQRVGEASAAGQSRTERLDAPATRNNSTAPAVSTAIPDATFPIPTLSIHTALAAWGAAHFGASARHRFPALPLPPSAYTAQTHSSDSNGWNTMCANCHMYWTDHYKQEGWVADESYGMVDADDGAEQAEDADNGAYLGEEEDEGGYDEEEGSFLTPEMIEIFRHSENWKREREERRLAELKAEKEEENVQSTTASADGEKEELTAYQQLEAKFGSAAYEIHSLERAVETRFAKDEATAKPVLWPVVPIRW